MAATLPIISIIIPSLNQGAFIEETLQSVFSQEYPSTEVIVIDGGSTDGTLAILEKYSSRIHYRISEKDQGQSDAINKGMRRASGDLLTWLCSDDKLLPGALHEVATAYRSHPQAGLFHAGGILFGDKTAGQTIGTHLQDLPLRYIAGVPFPQPSSFFTREAFQRCGPLDTTLHFGMDYALFQRIALQYAVIPSDSIWSAYRMHPDSKTVSKLEYFAEDWARVFSRFLSSVPVPEELLHMLEINSLYFRNEHAIVHPRVFNESEIRKIVFLFLQDQFRIRYELLQKKDCRRLLSMMKSVSTEYYRESGFKRLELRLKLIPVSLYRFIRSIKR